MTHELTQIALEHALSTHSKLFARYSLSDIEQALDSIPASEPYHHVAQKVSRMWGEARESFGDEGRDVLLRATLLWLITRFKIRAERQRFTDEILQRFKLSMDRITLLAQQQSPKEYVGISDLYLKDLAICRQQMFPAGAQVVEQDSGFHRTLMFRGGLKQGFAFAEFLLRHGGAHRHYYQIHTHLLETEDFNPEGWDACYLRIADMLAINPEVRGMWGGSWFYDPALADISPNLSYLRERPLSSGAALYFSEVSIESGALAKSQTRKTFYEEGRYLPKSYALIWPRAAMLNWAERFRRETRK